MILRTGTAPVVYPRRRERKEIVMQRLVALLGLAVLVPGSVMAADSLGPVVVLGADPGVEFDPSIAYHPNRDEALVVWTRGTANDARIMARLIDGQGQPIFPVFMVSDSPSLIYGSYFPEVIYEPSEDRYLVLWTYDYNGDLTDTDIVGCFVPSEGPGVGLSPFWVHGDLDYQSLPKAAVAPGTGEVMIVWTEGDIGSGLGSIEGVRWAADGSGPVTTAFPIASGPQDRRRQEIAWNNVENEFLVVYELESAGPDLQVYARRLTFAGSVIGDEVGIAGWVGDETEPRVASCRGRTLVVWTGASAAGPRVYARPVLSGGVVGAVTSTGGGFAYQQTPSLTCDEWSGAFYSLREVGAPGIIQGLYGAVHRMGGSVGADDDIRSGVGSYYRDPEIAVAGGGKLLAVWTNGLNDIEARWIDIDVHIDGFETGDWTHWDE